MLVYANSPVIESRHAIEIFKRRSEDPLVKVACIAVDTRSGLVVGYGVNRIIDNLDMNNDVFNSVKTDKHPAKKFLMRHAEIDLIRGMGHMPSEFKKKIKIICSLQPCMNCLNAIIDGGFSDIEWITENRHQHEQEIMQPFLKMIQYKKNVQPIYVQVPSFLIQEPEVESYFRDLRLHKDEEI